MMQFFYDLSSIGNFYSLVLTKLFSLLLVGSCTFCMYTLCSLSVFCFCFLIFLFLSADENSNIDFGALQVLLLLLLKITFRNMSKVKLIPSSISSSSVVVQL